jgi:hypothetical protein
VGAWLLAASEMAKLARNARRSRLRDRRQAGDNALARAPARTKGSDKMRVSTKSFAVFVPWVLGLGCGGVTAAVSTNDGGGGTGGAPSVDAPVADAPGGDTSGQEGRIVDACAAVAKAICDKRVACSGSVNATGVGIIRLFGSMTECLARQTLQCTAAFHAPGSGHSLATAQECVSAFAGYSCADFFANNAPTSCEPAGSRINGAACAFNTQCKSGFCTGEKNAQCGQCAPEPTAGASCASSDCGRGQLCDGTSMTCKNPGASGDSCDSNDDCGYGLVCLSVAAAGGAGTCKPAGEAVGTPCGGIMPVCDGTQGLACAGAVGAKTCVAVTFVGDGAPCGPVGQAMFAGCTAGSCYTAKALAGPGETGTCKANAADGAACDVATGPACEFPARCILGNGTAGTCKVPGGGCG